MSLDHTTANDIINFFVEAGIAGTVGNYTTDFAKSGVTKVVELVRKLWQKIRDRLKTDPDAKILIDRVEQEKTEKHLKRLIPFLEEAMEDEEFALELSQLVERIDEESGKNITKNFVAKDNSTVFNQASAHQQYIRSTINNYGDVPEKKF